MSNNHSIHVSVAICTWNRSALLDQTLCRMKELRIPSGLRWELLVVNNRCTDDTDAVLKRYETQLPLRRLFEPEQGHSCSRNCAIRAARGALLLWTDDDVLVDPSWLYEYYSASLKYTAASFFGGPVLPWFEGQPPRWLELSWRSVANAYAVRDFGDEPFEMRPPRLPFGANFAVRTEVQRRYLYNPNLGRKGHGMLSGDETAVQNAMLRDELTGMWIPTAQVTHFIPADRQTVRFVRRYYKGHGECGARTLNQHGARRLFGRPRWLYRSLLQAELRYRAERLTCQPRRWVTSLTKAAYLWGLWSGSDSSAGERGSQP
jgi:hypothetical protein